MKPIDFSKPVSFSIIEAILKDKHFTQLQLSREKNVSLGQVNKIVKGLLEKGLIEKEQNGYAITNPLGIIELIAKYRDMNYMLLGKVRTLLSKDDAYELLKGKGIFCLDSALEAYEDVKTHRVCLYANKGMPCEELFKELETMKGNKTLICMYSLDLPTEPVEFNGRLITNKLRTAIDLVCDNSAFAANRLFEELWGQKIL